jgi:hypothetical protein
LRYVAVPDRALITRPVAHRSAVLQSGLFMVMAIALAGCGSAIGGGRADPETQIDEPTCYREAKSEYEAAGASQNPNAGMLNIGAALAAKDNASDLRSPCGPAGKVRGGSTAPR